MSDTKAKKTNRRFKFKLRHVYTIMFLLIVVFAVLTWIVPSGQYQRKTISTAVGEREVAVAGTYEQVDKNYTDSETGETINLGQDIFAVLQAPTKGIQEAADVVAFVLLIGGSFGERLRAAPAEQQEREQLVQRIEQAKELLEGTSLSLERVVERVGYSDVPAFRRLFLRSVGLSPAQYRQRFRRPAAN